MSTYIIIGLMCILIVRLAYVNWKTNNILAEIVKDRTEIYNRYFETYYANCQSVVGAKAMNSAFMNVLTEIIPSIQDTEKQEHLIRFVSEIEHKQQELGEIVKHSEEFMVKYEIEKLVGRL